MSSDYDIQYSNDADGSCQECGEPTEEEWHAYCPACYAEQEGWDEQSKRSPDPVALAWHNKQREAQTTERIIERLESIERRLASLEQAG